MTDTHPRIEEVRRKNQEDRRVKDAVQKVMDQPDRPIMEVLREELTDDDT